MGETSSAGGGAVFEEHPLRQTLLDEVHARPFPLLEAPLRSIHLAFMNANTDAESELAAVSALFRAHGAKPPAAGARYHRSPIDIGILRWERHSEFSTYTWESKPGEDPLREVAPRGPFGDGFTQPGPLLSALRLIFLPDPGDAGLEKLLEAFDPVSLSVSEVTQGKGLFATDLKQDPQGYIRYLVVDHGMSLSRAGSVILRLHEIETYRTLALLGLPEAQAVAPRVRRMEEELSGITAAIRDTTELTANRELLARLTNLAGELEADVARISYRMSATRAYDEILQYRIDALDEKPTPGHGTLDRFLARRHKPAIRTCNSVQKRQEALAQKLGRAIDLLRARVDIDLEQQNGELLESMNRRARMQLRLQQTVEGLSIGAISYYLIGIVGYAAKGLKEAGVFPVKPEIVMGAAVPVVLGFVWMMVRRIRKHHAEHDDG
ncbi:MAG: DUF3422 domain-containing protein [Hyphomicrobiales bacterium]|nr:MAG: DUF3422 domain-containing protein [Hyphomicrobiales bacterium]